MKLGEPVRVEIRERAGQVPLVEVLGKSQEVFNLKTGGRDLRPELRRK
ncbi:MAG TPA: hypothetical protein VF189_00735 [Patescibacteria group bacterium]